MERLPGIDACPRPGSVSHLSHHLPVHVCCRNRLLYCRWGRRLACSRFATHNGVDVPFKFKLSPVASAFVAAAAPDSSAGIEEEGAETPVEESPDVELVTTKFVLERKCEFGEGYAVAGDDELLGAWDPQASVPMTWSEGHVWSCQVDLPAGKQYEFKFVLTRKEAEPDWQPGPNKSFVTTDSSSPLVISESWETLEVPGEEGAEEAVSSEAATSAENVEEEPEVDELATEQSEPIAAGVELELTETSSTTESEGVENKLAAPAEPELTDMASAHVIEQDDEATELTGNVVDTTTAVESTAEEDTLSPTNATEAVVREDEVPSVPTGDEAALISPTKDLSPAEEEEVSPTPEESTVVTEDAKGFKSFKFDTPEGRTDAKNGQPVIEGNVLDEVTGSA